MRYEDIVERPIMEVYYDVTVYPFRSDSLATKISLQTLTLKYHVVLSLLASLWSDALGVTEV